MRNHSNQRSGLRQRERLQRKRIISLLLVMAVSLAFVLMTASPSVHAQQNILPVKPGWDVFNPGTGYVIYSVTNSPRTCRPQLQITYILQGAKPLEKYDLAVGIFNLPGNGLTSFGVPRFLRNSFTREGVTAMHDAFIVGKFTVDRFGNGQAQVELDLANVPSGSYNAQFTWTRLSDTRGYYRTGSKYGEGFGQIIVP